MKIFIASSKTCGPCTMLKSRLEREKVDVEIKYFEDEFPLFKQYNIKAVPRLIIIDDDKFESIQGQDDIVKWLKDNIMLTQVQPRLPNHYPTLI